MLGYTYDTITKLYPKVRGSHDSAGLFYWSWSLSEIIRNNEIQPQLDALLKAIAKQIDALLAQAEREADFDKKIIDDIYATSRALTKVREIAQLASHGNEEEKNDAIAVRDILNLIEERIDQIAQQRADKIVAEQNIIACAKSAG